MITSFECTKENCPNFAVIYYVEGSLKKCECGGCGKILKPTGTFDALPGGDDVAA